MNKKVNIWMISTIFLAGLIIGFGVGKIVPQGNLQTNLVANANPPQQISKANVQNGTDTTVNAPINFTSLVNYDQYQPAFDQDGRWSLGNKNAKVVFEDFSDFQCPFCHKFFAETFPQLLKDYIATGKVYYVYNNYPLSIHPQAPKAAEAGLCAGDQNKYWQMHDLLFSNQDRWSFQDTALQTFQTLAQGLQLNMDGFNQCLSSGKYTVQVQKDTALGTKQQVSGTPTIFINGTKVVGAQPYDTFQTYIDAALKS